MTTITEHHHLQIRSDRNRGVLAEIVCTAPEGAWCRETCSYTGCSDERVLPHHHDGNDEYATEDSGLCGIRPWFDDPELDELYDGDVPDGVPLHDGIPVTLRFDGDGWLWSVRRA
jgi:hypothetical protein